jgi:hypothetical protein
MAKPRPAPLYPYSVRRQTSGGTYTGLIRYVVVRNPGGKRVSEYPPSTELAAWQDADRLNVIHWAKLFKSPWIQARDVYIKHRLNPWHSLTVIPYLDDRQDALQRQDTSGGEQHASCEKN